MKKLKHSILSLLLLMGVCIVSCSNDDGETSSAGPGEAEEESFTIPISSLIKVKSCQRGKMRAILL